MLATKWILPGKFLSNCLPLIFFSLFILLVWCYPATPSIFGHLVGNVPAVAVAVVAFTDSGGGVDASVIVIVALAVSHQRFVGSEDIEGMVDLPAAPTEVFEAGDLSTEVGTLSQPTRWTKSVFQVWIDLDLNRDVWMSYVCFFLRWRCAF